MKVKFTPEHQSQLEALTVEFVLNQILVSGPVGTLYNVCDLMQLTPNSLKQILTSLKNKLVKLDTTWIDVEQNADFNALNKQINLVNLLIGYKYSLIEQNEIANEKSRLEKQLKELEESQKTPEQLISEIKQKLASL